MSVRFLTTIIFLTISVLPLLSQHSRSADSLQHELLKTQADDKRAKINLALSEQMRESSPLLALEYARESESVAKRIKSDSLLATSYLSQANIFFHLGNYPRAMQLYQSIITIGKKTNDSFILAAGYGNIGLIYYQQNDFKNALKYYRESLVEFRKIQSQLDNARLKKEATLLSNIGVVYEQTKKFDSANFYYRDAYVLSDKLGDDKMMANILNNQGTLYRDKGDVPSAHQFYHKALRLRKAKKNKLGMTRSFNNLGQFFVETERNDDSAVFYLKQAIDLGKEIGYWQTVSSSTELLYKLYQQKGKYKEAYETLELNRQVNDSLFNVESSRKIAQLEMQFEFDRQQSLLAAKQKERELYTWMGGGALTFLLIIVTLLFFLQRSKTKRSELEQAHLQLERASLKNDLAIKDKELATNIMYLLNKNELINSMSEKLLEIKGQLAAENQPAIQKVVLDLQSNLQPELWQEFDFRFQQVHEQFYKVLNERFPDLSPSDRRLCAFLKLNMTTKEISAITHQNVKSIDVARTRLRKKLNLTGIDHNLVSFLLQLDNSDSANPS